MQLIEATLSFLVLVSLSAFLLVPAESRTDNSLYMYELQDDAKNVIHLKGGFANLTAGNLAAGEIMEKTGMCIEMGQTQLTSLLVGRGSPSSSVQVPQLRDSNLTGFARDRFFFGKCGMIND